jgi:primosomal protein N' (replication factor Y)
MSDAQVASVILDHALDRPLDYAVPEHLRSSAQAGMRVLVPVKGSLRKGTILELKKETEFPNIRPIAEMLSENPLISTDLFALANWMARHYCTPLRKVIQTMLPPSVRENAKAKEQLFVKALISQNELSALCQTLRSTAPLQAQLIDVMLKHPSGVLLSKLLEESAVSRSPLSGLIKKNILSCTKIAIDRSLLFDQDFFPTKAKKLNPEQTAALTKIQSSLTAGSFATHLLYGVTGSGKTEVYLQAIETVLSLGKGVIFLVPEIALTSQTVERLLSRFKEKIALLHHRLSPGERRDAWHQMQEGNVQIVIGARSAIFSPIPHLGLIIVDEEHEPSYKQQDQAFCYHARDVAVVRAKLCQATVVLGSATPSFESFANASNGKYLLSSMKQRPDNASLPAIRIIDMREEFAKTKGFTLFSEALLNGIEKRLKIGEQCLLFLNRRGYHTAQFCQHCAHILVCPHCDISLTYHRGDQILACHLCDYRTHPVTSCPKCKRDDGMKYKGAGTQQVERALHAIFPEVRTLRLDADTTRHKGSHEMLFKQFRSGKADILIGTQMISKGLHFPNVTLVGVLHADAGLNIPDFRSAEHAFQGIIQVSGRAGRAQLPGEVFIQTHIPDHPAILLAKEQNYEAFYTQEIASRKLFEYPPFSHFVKVSFSGPIPRKILLCAENIQRELIALLPPTYQILPIVPCGHAKIKDNYRFQFLTKGPHTKPITQALEKIFNTLSIDKEVRYLIDVDPLSTYF